MYKENSTREQITILIEHKNIPIDHIDDVLSLSGISPNAQDWRQFIDTLLFWLGSLALTISMLFFIAYNWDDIGHFTQFALVEVAIVLMIAIYYKVDTEHIASKIALVSASILLGVLLALYGQTYQTGADTWQLFFYWAILIAPWVFLGRFTAIWILWIAILNLSIVLYYQVFNSFFSSFFSFHTDMLWTLVLFNSIIHIIWELIYKYQKLDENNDWGIPLLSLASGIPLTWLVLISVVDKSSALLPTLAWLLYLTTLYIVYKNIKPTLFILASGCLSAIVVIITFLSLHLLKGSLIGGFFILALFVIGLGTASAYWLKSLHKEWQS